MQMVRGGHKSGRTATHTIGTTTSTWYTELSEETCAKDLMGKATLEEADKVAVPAKAGSILIFPGTTPHRSLNSTAENIRWSADFRLHKAVRPDGPGRDARTVSGPMHIAPPRTVRKAARTAGAHRG